MSGNKKRYNSYVIITATAGYMRKVYWAKNVSSDYSVCSTYLKNYALEMQAETHHYVLHFNQIMCSQISVKLPSIWVRENQFSGSRDAPFVQTGGKTHRF